MTSDIFGSLAQSVLELSFRDKQRKAPLNHRGARSRSGFPKDDENIPVLQEFAFAEGLKDTLSGASSASVGLLWSKSSSVFRCASQGGRVFVEKEQVGGGEEFDLLNWNAVDCETLLKSYSYRRSRTVFKSSVYL